MINKNNSNRRKANRVKKSDKRKEESDDNEEIEEEEEDSINEDDNDNEEEEEEEEENEEEEEKEDEEEEDKEDSNNEEEEESENDNKMNSNEEEEEEEEENEDNKEMNSNEEEEEENEKIDEEEDDELEEEEHNKDTHSKSNNLPSKEEPSIEIKNEEKPIMKITKEKKNPSSNKVSHKTKTSKPKSIKSQQLTSSNKSKETIKFDYMSSKSNKKVLSKLIDKSSNQSKQKTKKTLVKKTDNLMTKKNLLQNANIIVPEIQSKKRRKPNFLANPFISSVTSSTESHQSPLSTASFAHVTNDKTSNQKVSLNNKEKDNITKKGSLPNRHIKKDNMTLTQSEKGSKFKTSNSVRHYINTNIDRKFKKSKGSTKSKSTTKTKSSKNKRSKEMNIPMTINQLYHYFQENNIVTIRPHSIETITHKTLIGIKGKNRAYSQNGIVFQSNKISQLEKFFKSKNEKSSIRSVKTNQTKKKSIFSKKNTKPKRTNTNKMIRNIKKDSIPNEETELNPFFKKLKHTIIKKKKPKNENKVKENYKATIVKKKVEIPITNTVIEKENNILFAIEGNSFLSKVDTMNIPKKTPESNKKISTTNKNKKIISSQEKVYMLKTKLDYEEEPPINKVVQKEKETMYEESNNKIVNSKKVFDGKIAIMTYDEKIKKLKQSTPNSNQPLQMQYNSSVIDKSNTHLKIGDKAILKDIRIENISNIKDNQIKNIKEESQIQIKPIPSKKLNNSELINENQTIELTKEHVKITNDGLHMHVIESNSVQDSFNILGDKYHIAKNVTSDINTIHK